MMLSEWILTIVIVALQFAIIVQQRVRTKRLKQALLAWRVDTLNAKKKLDKDKFPDLHEDLTHTINVIDGALRR